MRKAGTKLTSDALEVPRYRAFAIDVANGTAPSRAGREHGIAYSTYSGLLRDPRVLSYIQELRARNAENLEITRNDVVHGVLEAVQDAKILGEPATQIRGWEVVAKVCGLNAPEKHEHEHRGEIHHVEKRIKDMSTKDLQAYLENLDSQGEVLEGEFEVCPDPQSPAGIASTNAEAAAPPDPAPTSPRTATAISQAPASSASSKRKKSTSRKKRSSAGSTTPKGAGAKNKRVA